jgi:hypothetical protein
MGNVYQITGRAVQGDVYKMTQRVDDKTKQPRMKQDGTPLMQHYIALAVPKNDPANVAFKTTEYMGEKVAAWPRGEYQLPQFADKIEDGDSAIPNKKMKRNCDREGFPGHDVYKFTNGFAPAVKYWDMARQAWVDSMPGGAGPQMKIGDYYTVIFDVESNKSSESPGMFLNSKTIAWERPGEAISSDADYSDMLGARGPGGNATAPAPAATPPAPSPAASPPPATIASPSSAPPPPHAGFMAPPPPTGPVMLPAANGIAYDAYIANGWSHAQLVAAGMVAA